MLNNHTLHSASGLKLKPWKFKVDRPINGNWGGGEVEAYEQQCIILQIILSLTNNRLIICNNLLAKTKENLKRYGN